MKKTLYILAGVLSLVSCAKEITPEIESKGLESRVFETELDASLEDISKLSLDGLNFTWNAGDQIKARCGNLQAWKDDNTDIDLLTASADGASVVFTGNIRYALQADGKLNKVYLFHSKTGKFVAQNAGKFSHVIPSTQSGRLSDALDNAILWAVADTLNITPDGDKCKLSATFKPHFAIVKLNIAEALGVKSVKLTAPGIAGENYIFSARNWNSGIGSNNFFVQVSPVDDITVERSGETLSGDIYFIVYPNAYDSTAENYCVNASTLKFVFTNAEGNEATVIGTPKRNIMCGSMKSFGNVTSLDFKKPAVKSGKLTLLETNTLTLAVADTLAGCTFFYEEGESFCPDPTTSSRQFFAESGIAVDDGSYYLSRYVKVLVHTEDPAYSDVILKGYLRNWKICTGANIIAAYQAYLMETGKKDLKYEDDGKVAADGLYLKMYNDNGGSLTADVEKTKNNMARIFIVATTLFNADCVFRHRSYTDQSTKDSNRDIMVYKNGSECSKVRFPLKEMAASVCENPNCAAGTTFWFRAAATMYNSEISMLETAENLEIIEEPTTLNPAFKFLCGANEPAVVVDSSAFGASLFAKGAKLYYTAGTEGFDALDTPSSSDNILSSSGIPVAATATKHDSLYVKVLARCDGYDDVYTELFVRSWTFGTKYQTEFADKFVGGSIKYDIIPTSYLGLTFDPAIGINGDHTNRATIKAGGEISAKAVYSSKVTEYFKIGSCSAGTSLTWTLGGKPAGNSDVAGFKAADGARSFQSQSADLSAGAEVKVKAVKSAQFTSYGVLEQLSWTPGTKSSSALGAEGFSGNSSYSL